MSEHTTHHDDCGCQSAALKQRIAELEQSESAYEEEIEAWRNLLAEANAKVEKLRAALTDALQCLTSRTVHIGYACIRYEATFAEHNENPIRNGHTVLAETAPKEGG